MTIRCGQLLCSIFRSQPKSNDGKHPSSGSFCLILGILCSSSPYTPGIYLLGPTTTGQLIASSVPYQMVEKFASSTSPIVNGLLLSDLWPQSQSRLKKRLNSLLFSDSDWQFALHQQGKTPPLESIKGRID